MRTPLSFVRIPIEWWRGRLPYEGPAKDFCLPERRVYHLGYSSVHVEIAEPGHSRAVMVGYHAGIQERFYLSRQLALRG